MPKLPKRPPISVGVTGPKYDRALFLFHRLFEPGVLVVEDWSKVQEHCAQGPAEYRSVSVWSIQQWMNDGAVLVEINRGGDGAVFSVEEPGFTTRQHRLWLARLAYPEPFMDMAYFYAEHADPQMMKYCDLVPLAVWPPEVQQRVRAYQRSVAAEQAGREAEFDALERKRREQEEFRKAGFPPHLDYIPRPPEE